MKNKRRVGTIYEELAADYLSKSGYEIIEKNFRCRYGEIDLIAKQDEYLVFVEVKYRSTLKSGYPEEAVNFKKQKIICRVADYYMMKNRSELDNITVRFDVVTFLGNEVALYQNAFEYCR
ncbi:YraN family protein [Anaerosacchariphilus polymeriproducens]|uniref:UPF0102 protein DWV06_11195 n=1 Tax=Anaerosacchariphilus polymeriproducens TaxID=1812858 RepID=A0A371ATN1_9FIRM|nr:YraN family protein [Anaerosacchariphilus polymeriproducens]RDU22933.1 YraN family protein [Anaerosacchariphilus polymeriproducens]